MAAIFGGITLLFIVFFVILVKKYRSLKNVNFRITKAKDFYDLSNES